MPDPGLRQRVEAWLAADVEGVDAAEAAELRALLRDLPASGAVGRTAGRKIAAAADAERELADRFRAPLTFGTAGLRGLLRAGPNGMNRAVVRRAAAGLAAWLRTQSTAEPAVRPGQPVVVGYDARHRSREFAQDSAAILAAAGFDARLLPGPLPTPVLAFAVQRFGAAAGVMVTASHNPPADNGYKVYLGDGAQIAPPVDQQIEAEIRAVARVRDVPLDPDYTVLDDTVVEDYVRAVAGRVADLAGLTGPLGAAPRPAIVHTALHGVGTAVVRRAFAAAGFAAPTSVGQQAEPDPDFPTVAFPNPEEPGALDLALALAAERRADLVIANDPDADRCAVAVPDAESGGAGWRVLRGDEVGVLLADYLMRKGIRGTYATTVVSSSMLGALAERHGVGYRETLTGFKWISRAAPDLVYGYEEALGYAIAPDLVRDKDGISAALLVAHLATELARDGSSLPRRLDELAAECGRHVTEQVSLRADDPDRIAAIMAGLRADPPAQLLGAPVRVDDLAPDVLRLTWDRSATRGLRGRVVVRPSGTEPKLKAYLEVVDPAGGPAALCAAEIADLRDQIRATLAR